MISISIVMPCLNEGTTIAQCILQAKRGLASLPKHAYHGEVIVVDNGSNDDSDVLAKKAGAIVVYEKTKGYGAALKRGIRTARGAYIIMGDCDGTYDWSSIKPFVTRLKQGADLVLGSRFLGTIQPDAMNFLHKYIGNPMLTMILNIFSRTQVSDTQTGMRAFTKQAYRRMRLTSSGMEFASEMIVKAAYYSMRIQEVPITYSARKGTSKLSPLSDAWRHIKFILIYSPTYALIMPACFLFILSFLLSLRLLQGPLYLWRARLDVNTLSLSLFCMLLGVQGMLLGIFARVYTHCVLHIPLGQLATYLLRHTTTERLLIIGLLFCTFGLGIVGGITLPWIVAGFPALAQTKEVLFGVGIAIIGIQLIYSSLLFGLMKESQ